MIIGTESSYVTKEKLNSAFKYLRRGIYMPYICFAWGFQAWNNMEKSYYSGFQSVGYCFCFQRSHMRLLENIRCAIKKTKRTHKRLKSETTALHTSFRQSKLKFIPSSNIALMKAVLGNQTPHNSVSFWYTFDI